MFSISGNQSEHTFMAPTYNCWPINVVIPWLHDLQKKINPEVCHSNDHPSNPVWVASKAKQGGVKYGWNSIQTARTGGMGHCDSCAVFYCHSGSWTFREYFSYHCTVYLKWSQLCVAKPFFSCFFGPTLSSLVLFSFHSRLNWVWMLHFQIVLQV